ncbi:S9 family peptidase [Nemorincola caseinilytica]|uniref:S9 family peptidase n=1 Tax=Nemorincola caseinilytica TaxID=2054315 RepID=A0ABP8N2A8_9BACT
MYLPRPSRSAAFALMLFSLSSFAQQKKKNFTIAEATNGMATTLAPKGIKNASWQPATGCLWQSDKDGWKVTDYSRSAGKHIYTVPFGKYPVRVSGTPTLRWLEENRAYFVNGTDVVMGVLEDDTWTWTHAAELPAKAENITVDKSRNIAYTIDNNLYVQERSTRTKLPVTDEQDRNIISGKAVHRDEFGIDRGIFFSPAGNYLAYYRMDQTMVKDYPIVRWGTTPATADIIKYPMAGGVSHEVTLRVYNVTTRSTVTLNTGTKNADHYLTAVTWSPDERYIFVAILNREQNHLWLNKYDAATGDKVKTLFEETDAKYVHPTHPLTFVPGHDDQFIWHSERDGYNHLYLYNTDGKLLRKLTGGRWVVNELAAITADGSKAIITTSKESPMEKHVYTLGLQDARLQRIDKEPGMHNVNVSADGGYILDVYSNADVPRNTVVYGVNKPFAHEVLRAENTLTAYDRPQVKEVTITAADGVTPLYGKLILPTGFDPKKKYPVIVYLYNGPNVQLLHNSFPASGNLWYEYMAQRGYIVFTMDGRGSWNRGLKFEQATFRHLGDVEIADQLRGVDYLRSLPYVDAKRMGVHGWSYGGFMTTSLMLRRPGVFKCAVAGGPVMDWSMYEVMYTERYMDVPDDNPKGYANANLLTKVKDLDGKFMLIHGTDDDVVVWQHSLNFLKKCVDEGVQVDYFVYPGHQHNVRGKDRVHLMQKVTDYFDLYLRP